MATGYEDIDRLTNLIPPNNISLFLLKKDNPRILNIVSIIYIIK